jgi:ABC-type glycerol-3-phosphate transport system substrate-binding protein
LAAVLDYYAQGVRQGIFAPSLLNYTTYGDYWSDFVSAEANLVGVDSIAYLSRKASVQNMALAPIPTLGGAPITVLDGWVWVLTNRSRHQEQARFIVDDADKPASVYTEAFRFYPGARFGSEMRYMLNGPDLLPDAWIISQASVRAARR